ncbi:MAG: hypothetical protein HFJ79_06340 [Clostridiales bacterium]|nr:hypothetical protein [Clostridiales bacterium]
MDKKKLNSAFDIDAILAEVEELKGKRGAVKKTSAPATAKLAAASHPAPEKLPDAKVSAPPVSRGAAAAPSKPMTAQAVPVRSTVLPEAVKSEARKEPVRPEEKKAPVSSPTLLVSAELPKPAAVKSCDEKREATPSSAVAVKEKETPPAEKLKEAAPAQSPMPRPALRRPVIVPPSQESIAVPLPEKPSASPLPADKEDDIKVFVPRSERGAGAQKLRLSHESSPTVVLPVSGRTKLTAISAEKAAAAGEGDEIEGQLRLDGLVEDGEKNETEHHATPEELEDQLRQARKKKVESFKLAGDEEEDNDPSEEPDLFDDGELEDYSSYEETEAVGSELTYRRRVNWIQTILTGAMELLLVVLGVMALIMRRPPMEAHLYVTVNLFFLFVMALINHRLVGEGIASLFRLRADADSGAAAAVMITLIHTALQYFHIDAVAAGTTPLFAPVAGLCLCLGSVGRLMLVKRVGINFRFVSCRGEKQAAHVIDDPRAAAEVGRPAVAMGEPEVAYFRKAGFLTRFLENSYSDGGAEGPMRLFVPLAAGGSLLLGVVYFLLTRDFWTALTVTAAAVCCSAPAAAMTSLHFPLLRGCSRVLRRGGMISGWQAVKDFGELDAVALDAQDLFPAESVLLHGIKTFSGMRIDEAILDAAAVSTAAGGPLSSVFLRVIENKVDILPEVDSLVYEQEMGLSGWVGGRRVLVGNRRLLENHGVDVPSRDYENRYTREGRQLVYLSTAGELSAMFVVSYVADDGIARGLRSLTGAGITLLVRTCDPNVTAERICGVFDLDDYYVEVLGAAAGRTYEGLASGEDRESEACIAANGRAEGMVSAITCCRRLLGGVRLSVISQVVGGSLGLAMIAFIAFYTSGLLFPPMVMMLYLLIWTAISWILPLFRGV